MDRGLPTDHDACTRHDSELRQSLRREADGGKRGKDTRYDAEDTKDVASPRRQLRRQPRDRT